MLLPAVLVFFSVNFMSSVPYKMNTLLIFDSPIFLIVFIFDSGHYFPVYKFKLHILLLVTPKYYFYLNTYIELNIWQGLFSGLYKT